VNSSTESCLGHIEICLSLGNYNTIDSRPVQQNPELWQLCILLELSHIADMQYITVVDAACYNYSGLRFLL